MAHPYPPRLADFSYVGRYSYSLEFTTHARREIFVEESVFRLVLQQILRAGAEEGFSLIAYCFMPDHIHLIVEGLANDSDCKAFIKAAKQYSGYYYKQAMAETLATVRPRTRDPGRHGACPHDPVPGRESREGGTCGSSIEVSVSRFATLHGRRVDADLRILGRLSVGLESSKIDSADMSSTRRQTSA